ncbi:MAG: 1-acyl-sn-glycerol-3-phosphate acyltransferase [Bacteroidetes bacterium]|nr:1-acyl-sn-glycerol-3-phosphate acyltransferase [Bacteroidota bacterium]
MLRLFSKLYLRLKGWKQTDAFPEGQKKFILIIAPHTSSSDFFIGIAFRSVLRLTYIRFLGKEELFKPPFGFLFRWLGGTPVKRSSSNNMVDQVVNLFNNHEEFCIALAPEGTRKKVERLKTGFYFIAKKAKVPIIMCGLDYENKTLRFSEPFFTTADEKDDFNKIISFFGPIKGKKPEQGLAHLQVNYI